MSHRRKTRPKARVQAARHRERARQRETLDCEEELFLNDMDEFLIAVGLGLAFEAIDILNDESRSGDADAALLDLVLESALSFGRHLDSGDPDRAFGDTIQRLVWLEQAVAGEPTA